MGRHRNDPRGAGQIMAITAAVLLLVALVVLGGFFLWRSLPGTSNAQDLGEVTSQGAEATEDSVLYIEVVGESCDVLVREAGGQVLTDTVLREGQHLEFDESNLEVTVSDPGAVMVYIRGELHDIADEPSGHSFPVDA